MATALVVEGPDATNRSAFTMLKPRMTSKKCLRGRVLRVLNRPVMEDHEFVGGQGKH